MLPRPYPPKRHMPGSGSRAPEKHESTEKPDEPLSCHRRFPPALRHRRKPTKNTIPSRQNSHTHRAPFSGFFLTAALRPVMVVTQRSTMECDGTRTRANHDRRNAHPRSLANGAQNATWLYRQRISALHTVGPSEKRLPPGPARPRPAPPLSSGPQRAKRTQFQRFWAKNKGREAKTEPIRPSSSRLQAATPVRGGKSEARSSNPP